MLEEHSTHHYPTMLIWQPKTTNILTNQQTRDQFAKQKLTKRTKRTGKWEARFPSQDKRKGKCYELQEAVCLNSPVVKGGVSQLPSDKLCPTCFDRKFLRQCNLFWRWRSLECVKCVFIFMYLHPYHNSFTWLVMCMLQVTRVSLDTSSFVYKG